MSPGGSLPLPALGAGVSNLPSRASTPLSTSRRNDPNATASKTIRRCVATGTVNVFTLPAPTTSCTLDMSSSAEFISTPPLSSASFISIARSSTDPNSAPVCRSARTTPSSDTIRAVSESACWSND
eukprot:29991-Pelagococcus_subviridis.AAC.3